MRHPPRGIVVGAGARGAGAYVPLLLERPELGRIVAVAEPDRARRRAFAQRRDVPASACFESGRALFDAAPEADFVLIASQDSHHAQPAPRALELGYHVLLEKPMATTLEECEALARAASNSDRILQVCHVLRYAPLFEAVKSVVDSGELGRLATIQLSENVSYWHYAHSYVRGHWRSSRTASPMILAKSCHDLDLLYWWVGAPPIELVSVASPSRLTRETMPEGAPERCIDGCPHAGQCPYDAVALYRDLTPLLLDIRMSRDPSDLGEDGPAPVARGWRDWPVSVITADPSDEGVERALRESEYGRCVYRIDDHDQPASQHVAIRFANDVCASFTMHGGSHREGRELRIDGGRGSLVAGFYTLEQVAEVTDHKTSMARAPSPKPAKP